MLCAIPIEIANRELDGVVYLAMHLARQGFPVLFGERMVEEYVFRLNPGKPVIYFDQDQNTRNNNRVLDAGGVVFNLSTEGLIMADSIERGVYREVVPSVTRLCLWGSRQAEILGKVLPEDMAERVEVTGHPSFDLLGEGVRGYYHDEAIIREHGDDYILVNTNFSLYNMKMDLKRYLRMLGRMTEWTMYQDPEVQAGIWASREYQQRVFDSFIEMVGFLAERFPERHVVVRPHPMEKLDAYANAFAGFDNVFVNNSGSVRKWIASSGCVIHHDCTTGLEALLMGKPVIGYRAVFDEAHTCRLQGSIGIEARNLEAVAEAVERGAMPKADLEAQMDQLRPYIANPEGGAAERIARLAAELDGGRENWRPERLGLVEACKCWRKHLSKLLRARQPGHNGRKVRYALEKFPRIPVRHVQECVNRFREIDPGLPQVEVRHLALNTYLIDPL